MNYLTSLPDSILLNISEFVPSIIEIKPRLKEQYFMPCVLHSNELLANGSLVVVLYVAILLRTARKL